MFEKLKNWWLITPEEATTSADAIFTRVLPHQRRTTISLWVIAIAYAYTITGFVVGSDLLGASSSLTYYRNMLVGYGVLAVLAFLVAIPAYKTGCSTTIFLRYAFGTKGYIVPSFILILLFILHSGFQCATFGEVLFPLGSPQFAVICLICGVLVIVSNVKGIKGLETAANIAIAFLILSVIICFIYAFREIGGWDGFNKYINNADHETAFSDTYLLNVVIGSWTIGCSSNGTYTRFCKNKLSMAGFCLLTFVLMQIVLCLLGSLSTMTVGTYIFVEYARRLNYIFGIFCTIAFLLALWTTINSNIYVIQIPIATIAHGSMKSTGIILGALAGIMGAAGFSRFVTPVLNLSGVLLPPFLGPMIVDYYLNKNKYFFDPLVMMKRLPKWNWASFSSSILAFIISLLFIPSWMPEAVWSLLLSAIIYAVVGSALKSVGIRTGMGTVEIDDELKAAAFAPYTPDELTKDFHTKSSS